MSGNGSQPKDKQDAFFTAATAARRDAPDEVNALIRTRNYWMHNGVFFEATDAFARSLNDLVASVVKAHGPNKVNQKQIQQIALDVAIDASLNKAKTFQSAVTSEVTKQYERIEPCFAVLLNKLKRLQIGPVTFEFAPRSLHSSMGGIGDGRSYPECHRATRLTETPSSSACRRWSPAFKSSASRGTSATKRRGTSILR
jgi:hypothetical protein